MTPTQLSLKNLRERGYMAQVVEKWNSFAKRRQDVFGFGDILAVRQALVKTPILLVQTTTQAHLTERLAKAEQLPGFSFWLLAGGEIEFHGWAKKGPRGKRKTWQVEIVRRGD